MCIRRRNRINSILNKFFFKFQNYNEVVLGVPSAIARAWSIWRGVRKSRVFLRTFRRQKSDLLPHSQPWAESSRSSNAIRMRRHRLCEYHVEKITITVYGSYVSE